MTDNLPSPELLRKLLRYDPETGKLFWRERGEGLFSTPAACKRWNTRYAGTEALATIRERGYRCGGIFAVMYRAHRVIWAMETGEWPSEYIDHINGDTSDNRISNLRDVSVSENGKNQKRPASNTSGAVGVHWDGRRGNWVARIYGSHGEYVGAFTNYDDAVAARKAAEARHGYHGNHGRECTIDPASYRVEARG